MSSQHKLHLYRYFEAIYRTQVEYIVSVNCQFWQLGALIYKKDNYVAVLSGSKIAINDSVVALNKNRWIIITSLWLESGIKDPN